MLDRAIEYKKMAEVETSLWWYKALHARIIATLEKFYGNNRNIKIFDMGCGTGGTLLALHHAGYKDLDGADLSNHAVSACHARGFLVQEKDMRYALTNCPPNSYDVILMNDVTCFFKLDDWPKIFESYYHALRPGGIILINAPAFRSFRGIHDRAVGIQYRLDPDDMRKLFKTEHFQIENHTAWPVLLSPMIFLTRTIQRIKLKLNPKIEIISDVELPQPWLNQLLLLITKLESKIPALPTWGSSLFIVMRAKK